MVLYVKRCGTIGEKLRGNMFREKINPIYFRTRYGIHTFFVKDPMDVLVLDDNNVVRKLKIGLKPNRIFFWNPRYKRIVELPNGNMRKNKIEVGSKIDLSYI